MPITGQLFRITDIEGFVPSYLIDRDQPDPETFEPLPKARVSLEMTRTFTRPRPLILDDSTTASDGGFALEVPGGVAGDAIVRVLASVPIPLFALLAARSTRRLAVPVGAVGAVPDELPGLEDDLFDTPPVEAPSRLVPAYRSQTLQLGALDGQDLPVYLALPNVAAQISQDDVRGQVEPLREELGVDELTARIVARGVRIFASRNRIRATFTIELRASLAIDLDTYVDHTIEDLDLEEHNLCITEEELERGIREGVRTTFADVNASIKDEIVSAIAEAGELPPATVESFLDAEASTTLQPLRVPVVAEHPVPGTSLTVEERAIEAKVAIGIPRALG